MDEKKIKELLRDLVDHACAMLDLINETVVFGDDQESECFMSVMYSIAYDNLDQAVFRALDSGVLDEGESDGDPHRNASESLIPDLCSYIWEEFRRAEDDQAAGKDNDCFSNEDGDMGYYMGRYVAMKKIVESDEFKKLDALVEKKEGSNGSF